jgi:hypothetical protein
VIGDIVNRMNDQFIEKAFSEIMAQLRSLQRPTAWEYKFEVLGLSAESGIEHSQKSINTEGADGWEVIAVIPKLGKQPSLDCLALMKRPASSTHK